MKIIGFIMKNKIMTAVIVIVLVVALYFSTTGGSFDTLFDSSDDLPTGSVMIGITDVATGSTGTLTLPIKELSTTASLFGTPPVLTTYNQDVWGPQAGNRGRRQKVPPGADDRCPVRGRRGQ